MSAAGHLRYRLLNAVLRRGAGCMLLAWVAAAHAGTPPLPDWVLQAAKAPPLQPQWRDAEAVYLLEDTLLTVTPDGRAVERYRAVVRILRPEGRKYAQPGVWFSKDMKLDSFHVWSIGPDGHHYTMKDSEYTEAGGSALGLLYIDRTRKFASPPGADPGGIVAWEYTEDLPPYFSEDAWDFQNAVPTDHSVYEIDLPPGWQENAVWARHAALQPAEVAPNHFRWEQTNIPGIDLSDVPLAPAWPALAGRMTVHFAAGPVPQGDALWAEIGDWYFGLAAPRSEGEADVAAEARSLAGEGAAGDFMAKVGKIADFMQRQIRYVAIEVGIGGWQPHAAEDVFRSRYGDCKDKATLTIAMLDAVGVRADWVMVDTRRGVIDPSMPTLFGDHMITAIEIPAGYENPRLQAVVTTKSGKRYLIFDPTNEYVAVGLLPEYLQGGYGVLAAGGDSQLIQLPVLPPEDNTVEREAKFALTPEGTLTGDVTILRSGTSAWPLRAELAADSDKDQREMVERMLRQDLPTFTLGTEKAENVRELDKPLELDYQVTAPLYAKTAGNLLLVRPRVVGSDAEDLSQKARTVPISFDQTGTWKDSFDVQIPAGYVVDDVPDPVHVDDGFATYRSEVKAQGNVLHFERTYVLKKLTLPAADYGRLRSLEAVIATDEQSEVVLKKQ